MLELDTRQIRMGHAPRTRPKPCACSARRWSPTAWLRRAEGLKAREAQGSTYLGQGIAIPHGTPDTRELVFSTGVRLLQFPREWTGAMASRSTWPSASRRSPTNTCSCNCSPAPRRGRPGTGAERGRQRRGSPRPVAGRAAGTGAGRQLVGLGQNAEDLDELAWLGARLLKKAGCVENGFAAVLQQTEPLPLGDGLCWLHSEQLVKRPGLASSLRRNRCSTRGNRSPGCSAWPAWAKRTRRCSNACATCCWKGVAPSWCAPPAAAAYSRRSVASCRRTGPARERSWPTRMACMPGAGAGAAGRASPARSGYAWPTARRPRLGEEPEPARPRDAARRWSSAPSRRSPRTRCQPCWPRCARGSARRSKRWRRRPCPMPSARRKRMPGGARCAGERLQAIAASPGIASGPAHVQVAQRFEFQPRGESPAHERERLLRGGRWTRRSSAWSNAAR